MKKLILFCALLIISSASMLVQALAVEETEVNEWLPTLIGNDNAGTEFYMTFHPCWQTTNENNFIKIFISSGVETSVTVSVEGKGYSETLTTVANDVIEFKLNPALAQPYRKSDRDMPMTDQVWEKFAVHVEADAPIICYGVTRYQYTSDGFLAIPVHALGKEYVVSSWSDIGSNNASGGQFLTSYTSAVAAYDGTKVRFTGGGPSFSKTMSGIKVGESATYDLNKGDVLMMASIGSYSDLSGSAFTSNKNIAVISGNFCSYVPEHVAACDYMIEQELPTHSWGTTYCVTPIKNRMKNSWIKIYAKEDNTLIYRDGDIIGELTLGGGGAREGECYLSQRVLDATQTPRPVVISGDKPISVTQYNTGQSDDGVMSDPFQMVLTPTEQWQNDIVFCTPGVEGNGFKENYLNILYEIDASGQIPDDFEFAGVVGGSFTWQRLKDYSPEVGDKLEALIDGKQYYSKILELPGDGVYKLRANQTFAAYANGFSYYDSYGFPVCASLNNIAGGDIESPICSPAIGKDGYVRDENTNSLDIPVVDFPADDEIRSNLARIVVDPYRTFNMNTDISSFMPGDDRETSWTAEVSDKTKPAELVIHYVDRNGNSDTDVLTYFIKKGFIRVDDGNFGKMHINQQSPNIPISIYNYGEEDLVIDGFDAPKSITENHELVFEFSQLDNDLADGKKITLAKGESYSFEVNFKSSEVRNYADSIVFHTNASDGDNICYLNVSAVLSVDEISESLEIFPTPCKGILNINANNELNISKISIYDVNGNSVMSKNITQKANQMDLSNYANGAYILELVTSKGKYTQTILLKK
jgi:IgGFc binding protein/type IX secretion system substrate protein